MAVAILYSPVAIGLHIAGRGGAAPSEVVLYCAVHEIRVSGDAATVARPSAACCCRLADGMDATTTYYGQ